MVLRKSLYLYRDSSGPGKCVRIHWDSISLQSCTRRPSHSSPRRLLRIRWRVPAPDSRPASASPRSAGTRSSWGIHSASLESESEIRSRTGWLKRTASHCTDASFDSLGWLVEGKCLVYTVACDSFDEGGRLRRKEPLRVSIAAVTYLTQVLTLVLLQVPWCPARLQTLEEKQRGEGASDYHILEKQRHKENQRN